MSSIEEDALVFAPEHGTGRERADLPSWRILVVDDDPDVHAATTLALAGEVICDRPLTLCGARSAAEAERLLRDDGDVAVILLDVVMESPHAGLDLVATVRRELGLHRPRIILRTGQPGYAPELSVVRELDINDYRTKQSLTRTKLLTLLTSAIRAYRQIVALDRSNAGLERIVEASSSITIDRDLPAFAEEAVRRLADVLGLAADGVFCTAAATGDVASGSPAAVRIVAGSGRFADSGARPIGHLPHPALRVALQQALGDGQPRYADHAVALPLRSRTAAVSAIGLALERPLDDIERRLAGVFVQSMAAVADTHRLLSSLHDTAYMDSLLGIPNRAALSHEIDTVLQSAQRDGRALELVDIDQFSEINEAFGDAFGDALLKAVAERLRDAFAPEDLVGRIANDTFGVIGSTRELDTHRLSDVFIRPFDVNGTEISVTASFARVDLTEDVHSGSEAIKFGHSALKRAKALGPGSHARYSREFGVRIAERTRLLQDLHSAFVRNRLYLAFQPQLDIEGRRVVGLEALMRWRSDSGVLIPPHQFVPIAEQSGLILQLGQWVLRAALDAQVALRNEGFDALRMAVNVSMTQMLDSEFESQLDAAIEQSGADPRWLELEVTESIAMHSPELVSRKLQRLRSRGIAIAIDDFGTGFSSLAYLERLAVDRLKIDRAFVDALGKDSSGARIAEMVVELGKTLGLRVIAEGVETEEQRQRLAALGCDELQGFLFSPALTGDELRAWLAARR